MNDVLNFQKERFKAEERCDGAIEREGRGQRVDLDFILGLLSAAPILTYPDYISDKSPLSEYIS